MDNELEFDKRMLKIAEIVASSSKCVSYQVGAILVKDKRIVSTGYNGTPQGYINCCQVFDKDNFIREEHSKWSELYEIHAESNALLFAAKNGVSTNDTTLYCTLSPCFNCSKHIVQAGIKRVVYSKKYDRVDLSITADFFIKNNVVVDYIEL